MDRIKLLQLRRAKLLDSGKIVRKKISALVDEASFVELDSYSFSHNDFYGEDAEGEGVITGYATINNEPFCIVAQNPEVMRGGLTLASCNKIIKCMEKALESNYPIVYLLDSCGVQLGEGVNVLEGIAKILEMSSTLKEASVAQFSVVTGNVYGSLAILCASCDFNYVIKGGCVSFASPLVITASENKNEDKEKIGGKTIQDKNNLFTQEVKDITELKTCILKAYNNLSCVQEVEDDFNRVTTSLNTKCDAKTLISAVFDKDTFIELNAGFENQVVTGVGFVGGISIATIIFNAEKGVYLDFNKIQKINSFIKFANRNNYPVVTFVNTLGLKQDYNTNNSLVLKEIADLIDNYKFANKISIITGYAIGLGYTLFASKSMNTKYSFAFATANVGLFDENTGALVELNATKENVEQLTEKYMESIDPINAAKNGYIDNIIEPKYVRQYLISALQTLEV